VYGDVALRIDDRDLPAFETLELVFGQQSLEDLLSGESLPQQFESARTVTAVHRRLRGDCADAGFCPRHVVADAEHARCDGHAEVAGLGVERDD